MTAQVAAFKRDLARCLRAKGMSLRGITKEVGSSHLGIDGMLRGQQARGLGSISGHSARAS